MSPTPPTNMSAQSHRRRTYRSWFSPASLWIALSWFGPGTFVGASEPPNILFIYADDQNLKTLSCYEGTPQWVSTPHIDQLAHQGLRFKRAYFGAWCMPSRASFLTGRFQHGIESMRMEGQYPGSTYDPSKCRFWPSVLRENGYHTAQIGKWHTGIDSGLGRDWDHQIVWNRPAHPENAGNYFYDQMVTFNGVDQLVEGYSTDNYTDWAVDYIRGKTRDENKPWYLWLCYGAVHGPTTPADRHEGDLSGNQPEVPADIFGPWPDKPDYLNETAAWYPNSSGYPVRKKKKIATSNFNTNTAGQPYDDWVQQTNECMMAVDEGVGRVIEALKESGQFENTLIVYTADQGYALGEHGLNQKVAPYDAALASPLIMVQHDQISPGTVCEHPVTAPDLVGLFAKKAGIQIPWKIHARDIQDLIDPPSQDTWNQPMIMTHTGRMYGSDTDHQPSQDELMQVGSTPWYVVLRDGQMKYIRYLIDGETEELYDLEADPEELTNLALLPDYQDRLATMRTIAIEQLRKTDAGLVDWMPPTAAMKATDQDVLLNN